MLLSESFKVRCVINGSAGAGAQYQHQIWFGTLQVTARPLVLINLVLKTVQDACKEKEEAPETCGKHAN